MNVPEDKRDMLLKAFIEKQREARKCPICEHQEWSFDTTVFQLVEYHAGKAALGGYVKPVIAVTCANCGYTYLVNAIHFGVVEKSEEVNKEDSNE